MSDPISSLPKWRRDRLDLLVTALGDPPMSYAELASLAVVAGNDELTIENCAAVLRRVTQSHRFTGDDHTHVQVPGKWVKTYIDHNDGADFDDNDEVMGWLTAVLVNDVLAVTYHPDTADGGVYEKHPAAVERYRLVPLNVPEGGPR